MTLTFSRLLPIEKWVHCPQCGRSLAPVLDVRKKGDHIVCSACNLCLTCEERFASTSPE